METTKIRVVNPDFPINRQQAVLTATKEARFDKEKKTFFPDPPLELQWPKRYCLTQTSAMPRTVGDTIRAVCECSFQLVGVKRHGQHEVVSKK